MSDEYNFEEHQHQDIKDVKVPKVSLEEANEALGITDQEPEKSVYDEVEQETAKTDEVPVEEKQKAKKYGHLGPEEYEAKYGTMDGYKDEREFNKFGEIYPEIKSIKEENKHLKKNIDYLVEAQKRNAEEAVRQARASLERQLQNARINGDIDAAVQATERLSEMKILEQQNKVTPAQVEQTKIDKVFLERNPWFNKNTDYQTEAQQIGADYVTANPGCSYASIAQHVEQTMRYLHNELNIHTPVRNELSASKSNVNKSTANTSISQERAYNALSAQDKMDFEATKEAFDNTMKNLYRDEKSRPKYTIKDFLDSKSKIRSPRE